MEDIQVSNLSTITDFWCWDKQGVLVLIIAIPIGLLQTHLLFTLGASSQDWFSSPVTSMFLMYLLLAFWFFGMYPTRCIRRTLIPQIIESHTVPEETISAYRSFVAYRRTMLFICALFALVIFQVIWIVANPYAWAIGMSMGYVIFAWILLSVLLFVYLLIIGIGGRLLNRYLKKRAGPQFEEIFKLEDRWMDTHRARQSL